MLMKQEKNALEDTGERLLPSWKHITVAEHLHRYALAMSLAAGKDVLDIASGEGYGSNLLGKVAKSVTGVDVSLTAVRHAEERYGGGSVRFLQGTATAMPFRDAAFDLVVSFETLEHLLDHAAMVAELRRVLTDDGLLLISSPDKAFHGDREGYVNSYHVNELYEQEFIDLLARSFPYRYPLRQQVLTFSALWPGERTDLPEIYSGSFDGFSSMTRLPEPSFHVVVAGNQPIPAIKASLFDGTAVAKSFASRQETEIANLNAYVASLQEKIRQQDEHERQPKELSSAEAMHAIKTNVCFLGKRLWRKMHTFLD